MDLMHSTVTDVRKSVSTALAASIATNNTDKTSDRNSEENSNIKGNGGSGNGIEHGDIETAERIPNEALGSPPGEEEVTDPAVLLGQSLTRFSLLFNKLVETLCEHFRHAWLAAVARIHDLLHLYLTTNSKGGINWLTSQLSLLYHERRELIVHLMKEFLLEQFHFELYYSLEGLLASYAQPVISRSSVEKRLDALKEADLVKDFDLDAFKQELTRVHSMNNTTCKSMNRLQALLLRIPPVYFNLRADIFLFVLGFPAATKPDQSRHNLFIAKGRWLCNATGSRDAEERLRKIREIVELRTGFSPDALDQLMAQKVIERQLNEKHGMNEEDDINEENRPIAINTASNLNSPASRNLPGVECVEKNLPVPNMPVSELGNKRPRSEDDVGVKKKKKKKRDKQKNSLEGTPSSQPVTIPPTSPPSETYRTVTREEKILEGEDVVVQWMDGTVVDRTVVEEHVKEALAKLKTFYSDEQRYQSCEEAVKHLLETFFDPSKGDSEIIDLCKKTNSKFVPPNCIEMRGKFREIFPSRQFVRTPRYRTVLITVREPVPSHSSPSHTTRGTTNGKMVLEKEEGELSDSEG